MTLTAGGRRCPDSTSDVEFRLVRRVVRLSGRAATPPKASREKHARSREVLGGVTCR